MNNLKILVGVACLLTVATQVTPWARGQDGNTGAGTLAAAQELSAASGRPIFAIAGSHT